MTPQRMLFIGGPLHGQFRDVEPSLFVYPVAGDDEAGTGRGEHIYRHTKIGQKARPADPLDIVEYGLVVDVMLHDSIERGSPELPWQILDAVFPRHLARRLGPGGVTLQPPDPVRTPEGLAMLFHSTYERLAPVYGYTTRRETARPWSELPAENRSLMVSVCAEVLGYLSDPTASNLLEP